ncbi:uncharacterized protein DS421_15g498260 [Arachis hypogaea]|nr:uncharacterized protein DS421_15g498260 [Arachis hypogaea]
MGEENTGVHKGDLARIEVESRQLQKGESSTRLEEAKKIKPAKDSQGNGWTKKVEVPVAKENFDWLLRSLVGGTTRPIDFKSLRRAIVKNFPQVVEVRELGAYKALLMFDSVKNAEVAFTFKMNSFLQFFYVETFHTIGSLWGEVVKCDDVTKSALSFSVGCVLIDTCVFDVIKEWIHITVGTSGFDVFVKEIGREIYGDECFLEDASIKAICVTNSTPAGDMGSTAAVWDPTVDLIRTRANDGGENKGNMREAHKIVSNKASLQLENPTRWSPDATATQTPGRPGEALCEECCTMSSSVHGMDNQDVRDTGCSLPCALRRGDHCRSGGEAEERSNGPAQCNGKGVSTVARKTRGDLDDKLEVEGFVDEPRS